MTANVCVRLTVAAMLLGSLACTAAPRDATSLQGQRTAELDRLDQQVGMGYARVAPNALEARINAIAPPVEP